VHIGVGASFDHVDVDAVDLVADLSTLEMISGRVERARRMVEWVRGTGVAVSTAGELPLDMTVAWLHGREGTFLDASERAPDATEFDPFASAYGGAQTVIGGQ
jgi:hypothetical protein